MPDHPHATLRPLRFPSLRFVALFIVLSLTAPAWSGEVIYRYIDDEGVPTFTGQRDTIPLKYQDRVQALDAVTFQPLPATTTPPSAPAASQDPEFQTPAGLSSLLKPADPSRQTGQETGPTVSPAAPRPIPAEPVISSRLDQLAGAAIPLPSPFQLGVGLTAIVLIVCAVLVSRMVRSLILKTLLKSSVMLLLGGAVYLLYFSGMNERIAETTRQPDQRTTTGKELLGDMKGKADQMKSALEKAAAPVTTVIEKTKAATVGDVNQAVNAANQSNQQLDQRLREIEASP